MDQRRLELYAFYAPATTRSPLATTRRQLTPSGSSSLAIVTTPLEWLPPGLTQVRPLETVTVIALLLLQTNALLLHGTYILYTRILYITIRVTPAPLRIQSYSRDFDSACKH